MRVVKKCLHHKSFVIISLTQPLETNNSLEQMFQKLKEEIVPKFEERFIEQYRKLMS